MLEIGFLLYDFREFYVNGVFRDVNGVCWICVGVVLLGFIRLCEYIKFLFLYI